MVNYKIIIGPYRKDICISPIKLKDTLEIDKLLFVPWGKSDPIGHSDGMVRFIDEDTILINKYGEEDA